MGAVSSIAALIKKGFPEDVAERISKGSISEERGLEIIRKRDRRQALRDEAAKQRHGDPDTSYRGSHTAPDADYGAPLHDLTQMIPEDIYGPQGMRYYGLGQREVDREAFDVLNSVRGNPDAEVTMYRAVPPDAPESILDGDWVTTSEEYARIHGENALDGDYKILAEPTYARRLQSEGYPYEFGYMENGMSTPGFMALLGAGGAGATAAARGSHPVSQQAGQVWDDLKGTAKGLLDVAEMPARGLQGLGRVGYGMLTGEGFDEAMKQGNDVLQGGTEAAAQRAGDEVFRRTGSAEMATAAYTAVMTGSPI